MTFRQLAKAVYAEMGRLPHESREELETTKVYDPYFGTASSATHLVMLEIDPETYKVDSTASSLPRIAGESSIR